jgi:cytochrome b561
MTPTRYHPLLSALHWVLAALILAMLALGFLVIAPATAGDPGKIDVLRVHMATGSLILALMLARVIVRWRTRRPDTGRTTSLQHLALYLLVFAMVATGFAMAVLTGLNLVVFGAPGQPLPAGLATHPARLAHFGLAVALGVLAGWHLGFALFRHVVRRQGVFQRVTLGPRSSGGA